MLLRVSIENLVIVESAAFEPGPGLTCITGETGAGKTLLAGAVSLLFGAEATAAQIGTAGDHAYVEGEFAVDESFWADPALEALAELRPDGEETLVLARRISGDGRTRALAWGRTVSKADQAAAGRLLVAIAGQHAQRRLLEPAHQRRLLDRFGGEDHDLLVRQASESYRRLSAAERRYDELAQTAAGVEQKREWIEDSLQRLDAVSPDPSEEAELLSQRDRARHHAAMVEAVSQAAGALSADEPGGSGAVEAAGMAYAALDRVSQLDGQLAELGDRCLELQAELADVAGELRSRLHELAAGPGSLEQIEERLSAYDELKRRFGGTTEAVCAAWTDLRSQYELLADGTAALDEARARVDQAREQVAADAKSLSASRSQLATQLSARVQDELASLAMASGRFQISVQPCEPGPAGADAVEMLLAANEGAQAGPLSRVASGGEMSRVALALQVASGFAEASTLLFDEVDAGIGGNTAHAVAHKLAQLAQRSQIICITHLPQIAARADLLVRVEKSSSGTALEHLDAEEQILEELCRMSGAAADDPAARAHAASLRARRAASAPQASGEPGPGAGHKEPRQPSLLHSDSLL